MLGRLSIRAKLTAAFAAAMIVVLALAGLFVYLRVASGLTETIDDGLEARVNDLAALAERPRDPPRRLSGGLFEGEGGFSQILGPDGEVLATTLEPSAGPALDPAQLDRAASGTVLTERVVPGIEDEARILARPATTPDGAVIVVAGASTDDRSEALAGIAGALLIGAPLALVLASAIGYVLAARSLAPVEQMRRRASGITLDQSGERLPLPRAEDEIHRLGETLNTMLDRIEASLERQRVFVADASHELRTPLAVLRAELELAERTSRTQGELEAAIRSAAEEVERLSRLAEDLLVVARSDQGRLPIRHERIDLGTMLARVGERFARRASESGRGIVVDAPAHLEAELDVLRIEQAIGNLVDNALRHGEGEVRLSARLQDGLAVLDVADQGPGFPAGFEGEAFERFTRADEGRGRGGTGL
ncbi:MAG: histidine kinase dimerization/phospho-acceptor domain-containing protein, partial [Actinomycetota bacterium]